MSRTRLSAAGERMLSSEEQEILQAAMERLLRHEPIQYVLGWASFGHLELEVGPGVLIPRPETEEVVAVALDRLRAFPSGRVLDAGTGSGCIALSLARERPDARVTAWDISEEVLAVAQRNARRLNVTVTFTRNNILSPAPEPEPGIYDVIVSNPPYVPKSDLSSMEPHVHAYEPHLALFVPDEDPLMFYRALGAFAQTALSPEGAMVLEVHAEKGADTEKLLQSMGFDTELRKDSWGKDRILVATRCPIR